MADKTGNRETGTSAVSLCVKFSVSPSVLTLVGVTKTDVAIVATASCSTVKLGLQID